MNPLHGEGVITGGAGRGSSGESCRRREGTINSRLGYWEKKVNQSPTQTEPLIKGDKGKAANEKNK